MNNQNRHETVLESLQRINAEDAAEDMREKLLPCPFCGGSVAIESTVDGSGFLGIKCRNTINLGGSCAIQQIPSRTREAAVARWNMRATAAKPADGWILCSDRLPTADDADEHGNVWIESMPSFVHASMGREVKTCRWHLLESYDLRWHPKPKSIKPAPPKEDSL